ncbi:MAG: hypothetical protein IKO75_14740, partial [Bacteroidales bacterium]|nr:hypothetical protein [Bacteroidales bacterium]
DSPTARFQELAFLDMGLFNVCLRRLEASPPKPRRLAQIKKLMRKPWSYIIILVYVKNFCIFALSKRPRGTYFRLELPFGRYV